MRCPTFAVPNSSPQLLTLFCMEDIPLTLCAALFPTPGCTVSQLLSFQFPIHGTLQKNTASSLSDFWLTESPILLDMIHIPELCSLPLPPSTMLDELATDKNHSAATSVHYTHLPASNPAKIRPYPRWILSYWVELTRLRKFAQGPWLRAESWVNSQACKFRSLDNSCLVSSIQVLFSTLPWMGYTCGFLDPEPITKFAYYLSSRWLATSHIEQQLELFTSKITHEMPLSPFKIVSSMFLKKIVEIHCRPEEYNAERAGTRHLWAVGEELASQIHHQTTLCGIFNVDNSHWVTVIVDTKEGSILYGDSLRGWNHDILDALQWWIKVYVHGKNFNCQRLMIGQQTDSVSCALFAVNALVHFITPLCSLLSQVDVVTQHLQWFKDACTHDSNAVSQSMFILITPPTLCCSTTSLTPPNFLNEISQYSRTIKWTTFLCIIQENNLLISRSSMIWNHTNFANISSFPPALPL